MLGKIKNFLFTSIKGSVVGKVARWGFISLLTFWGPGPIIAVVGIEGLIATTAITQSGLIEYGAAKLL